VIPRTDIARDLVVLACAISAGVHAALAPDHFADGTAAGAGFVVAAAGLAGAAVALTLRPTSAAALGGSAILLAGLLVSYALAVTSGLPVLHPTPEPLDGLAVVTKAIEAVGLIAASQLLVLPHPKGSPT
jgi:hypothetical protein